MINIKFNLKTNELRPAIICEDGKDIEITACKIPKTIGAESIIRLENVEGASISKMEVKGSAGALVSIEGENSKGTDASKNKLPGIKKLIEPAPETGKLSNSSQF